MLTMIVINVLCFVVVSQMFDGLTTKFWLTMFCMLVVQVNTAYHYYRKGADLYD